MNTTTVTTAGRTKTATLLQNLQFFLAWGSGDPTWDGQPQPDLIDQIALVAEVGRRIATHQSYVLPDVGGAIELPNGETFTQTNTPSPWLFIRVIFDFADAPTAQIREVGLFVDVVTQAGLPAGQRYFTPDQIVDQGRLFACERYLAPIARTPATKQVFEFVLPILG